MPDTTLAIQPEAAGALPSPSVMDVDEEKEAEEKIVLPKLKLTLVSASHDGVGTRRHLSGSVACPHTMAAGATA